MVIGNGVIANRFIDYKLQSKYLIFAGSINNSTIQNEEEILKEEESVNNALLKHPDITFIYFSTCSILDTSVSGTAYVKHKIRMERIIRKSAKDFLIIRLPQIIGLNDTKSSLINYFFNSIYNHETFDLWQKSFKNFIDIDDVYDIVAKILEGGTCANKIINVANTRQISVLQVVETIEKFTGESANYNLLDKGVKYDIDISDIESIVSDLNIDFSEQSIIKYLNKYFGHMRASPKLISLIVPTYNEEHGIEEFYRRAKNVLVELSPRFNHEIIFVNDSSTDNTLGKLKLLAKKDPAVKLINFSRNFGNQVGITAGIDFSNGDIAVIIDDDLQDPPEIIVNMIAKWDRGFKVVYGVRPNRKGVNRLFKLVAKLYYRALSTLSDTKIPNDTGDFRLLDRTVIENLKKIKEKNRYYRGLVSWVGFSQVGIIYERDRRYTGTSTFSFKKYVKFALTGLSSFTEKPLYFSSIAGLFITVISFFVTLFLIIGKIVDPSISIQGWTSTAVIVLFFGGIQLLSIGVVGIYISKIYKEVIGRPLYIIESTENFGKGAPN